MVDYVKRFASRDGKVYEAYANPLGYFGVIYNKELFQKAGIKLPLKTYQELLDACEALQKIGVTPIGMAGKGGWQIQMIEAIGGNYIFNKSSDTCSRYDDKQSEAFRFSLCGACTKVIRFKQIHESDSYVRR